jgi:hypothetical protein
VLGFVELLSVYTGALRRSGPQTSHSEQLQALKQQNYESQMVHYVRPEDHLFSLRIKRWILASSLEGATDRTATVNWSTIRHFIEIS